MWIPMYTRLTCVGHPEALPATRPCTRHVCNAAIWIRNASQMITVWWAANYARCQFQINEHSLELKENNLFLLSASWKADELFPFYRWSKSTAHVRMVRALSQTWGSDNNDEIKWFPPESHKGEIGWCHEISHNLIKNKQHSLSI